MPKKKTHSSATSGSLMTRTVQLLRHDAYNCTITSAWRVQLYNYGWNQACWWPIRFENFDIVMIMWIIIVWEIEKYQDLKREIARLCGIRHLEAWVPVVVGALGLVSKRLDIWLEKLGVTIRTRLSQKVALLSIARILRKLLEAEGELEDLWPFAMACSFCVP